MDSEDWMRQYKGKCFVNCKLLCGQYAITVADCNAKTRLPVFSHSLDSECCSVSNAKPGTGSTMDRKQ